MAEYQIGSQTYELPDNLPPQQLNQILSQLAGQQANNEPDTSFSSAFQSGIDAPLENMATTARMVGAKGTADTLSGLTDAPTNYESASNRVGNPQEGDFTVPTPFGDIAPGYLPRAAVEQAGQFAGSLATRAGGAAVGTAVGGLPGGIAGGLAGPALFEFVQQLGPVAAQRAKNNGRAEPTWDDWTAAAGTAGLSGALNSIGVKGFNGAGLLNRTLKEGVTESTQSVVEQTGSTAGTDAGFNVDPKQAMVEGIIGGTSAGGIGVATDTVSGAANLTGRGLRAAKDAVAPAETGSDTEAAADFAADLQRVSDEDNYDLSDVDTGSATGARAAVDTLHMEYGSQIEVMVSDLVDRLKETADDTQLQALEKAKANAAKRKAKNKVKSRVDPTDFQVIEKLTAGTDEGAKLIALMRKSNELSALANKSVKGGISQYTDVFNPLDSDGRYNIGRAIAAPVSGLGAIASGGVSLAPAIAGRAIDAVTGRRSRVANYVKQNQGNQGIQIPDLPSERTRKQQEQAAKDQAALAEEERKKALALEATQLNDPPKGFPGDQNQSPQYAMETGTGLTRRGVADALKVLRRTRPKLSKAIDTYQTMLETGQQSADLTPLIGAVKGLKKKYPQLFENTQGETDNSAAIPTSTATESPNIKRGIESNLKFAQDQIDKVDADNTMNDFDKIVAKDALRELSANLGSDPVASAEGILKRAKVKARKKSKIDDHVKPYVDRVKRQQKQAAAKEQDDIEGFVDLRLPEEAPPKRKHREIGEELMSEQNQRFGRDLDPYNDGGDFETVAAEMTKEAQFQSDKTPDAAHWYDNDIRQAIATTAEVLPEINETPDHRQLFLLLAALTSVGQKPKLNWRYAGSLAMHYYRSGELGEIGQIYSDKRQRFEERLTNPVTGKLLGQKAGSIEPGLYILRHMLNTRGLNETISWLNSTKTKAEIDAMRKEAGYGPQSKIKGGKNAVVPAIQMFGPKVGPFYMNLNGIHEVTVDLWASRTVRRHTGGLLADPKLEGSGLVDAPTELERPTMKDLFARVGENLGVTPQSAQAILWAYEQELYNDLGASLIYEKFSEGAEAFRETEAVAYADRDARIASGQAGSGTNDAREAIDLNQQFDPRRPDSRLQVAAGSRPASPEEVRDVKPTTDAMFEIGKPGSQFENGIPDLETATKLAEALGFALHIASNKNDLARVFGKASMGNAGFHTGGARSARNPSKTVRDTLTGRDVRTSIGVLGEYKNPRNPEESVTPLEALFVALHEIGHGIEGGFIPGLKSKESKQRSFYNRLSDGALTQSDRLYEDTFRDAIAQLMDAASGFLPTNQRPETFLGSGEAQSILDEIVRQQSQGVLDQGETPIRPTYRRYGDGILAAEAMGNTGRAKQLAGSLQKLENEYFQTPHELAADLIGLYLLNPKKAKAEMPQATKLVRDILNKSDVVQFYSMPLAAMVAAIFANMLLAEGEEEERKGILAQQTI